MFLVERSINSCPVDLLPPAIAWSPRQCVFFGRKATARPASQTFCTRPTSTAAASITSSRASRTCCSPCWRPIATESSEMLLEPAWKGISRPVEKMFALLARYRQALCRPTAVRLPDRLAGTRDSRARSTGSRGAGGQLRRVGQRRGGCLDCRGPPVSQSARPPRARRVRADDDGRRRDAKPHPSRRRLFRPRGAPIAQLHGLPSTRGRSAAAASQT